MNIQIKAEYPDKIIDGHYIDRTQTFLCETIEDLHKELKRLYKEGILSHVHLDFVEHTKVKTLVSKGSVIVPFKNKIPNTINL